MVKKLTVLALMMVMVLGLFGLGGCSSTLKITDFEGLGTLPRNPSKIIFATNSQNFYKDTEVYGDPIEYEIQSTKIAEVTEKLFSISYKAMDKNIKIDMSPIIRYLVFYDADGSTWTVGLGLRRHNGRWYSPVHDEDLIALLYESITK